MKTNLLLFIFLLFGLNVFSQTILLQEYFDDVNNFPPNWSNIDKDGDGNKWKLRKNSAGDTYTYSESWANDVVLFPNNYLITPQIDLTGLTGTVALSYLVGAADPEFLQTIIKSLYQQQVLNRKHLLILCLRKQPLLRHTMDGHSEI